MNGNRSFTRTLAILGCVAGVALLAFAAFDRVATDKEQEKKAATMTHVVDKLAEIATVRSQRNQPSYQTASEQRLVVGQTETTGAYYLDQYGRDITADVTSRVTVLPEDGGKWYLTVLTGTAMDEVDQKQGMDYYVLNWFASDPKLAKVKDASIYTHYDLGNKLYQARVASWLGQACPTVCLQDNTGKIVYKASGKNVPRTYQEMEDQLAQAVFQWKVNHGLIRPQTAQDTASTQNEPVTTTAVTAPVIAAGGIMPAVAAIVANNSVTYDAYGRPCPFCPKPQPQPNPAPQPAPQPQPLVNPVPDITPNHPDKVEPKDDDELGLGVFLGVAGVALVLACGVSLVKSAKSTIHGK